MTAKQIVLEIGSGNDLHGGDYTKAAVRAIEDATHHSSLTLLRTLGATRMRCGSTSTSAYKRRIRSTVKQ